MRVYASFERRRHIVMLCFATSSNASEMVMESPADAMYLDNAYSRMDCAHPPNNNAAP